MELRTAAYALIAAGFRWPNLNPPPGRHPDDSADAIDRDILKAWRELGIHPKKESGGPGA